MRRQVSHRLCWHHPHQKWPHSSEEKCREEGGIPRFRYDPRLVALLRGTAAPRSGEVHLRNREMEVGTLAPLCALAKVGQDYCTTGFMGEVSV